MLFSLTALADLQRDSEGEWDTDVRNTGCTPSGPSNQTSSNTVRCALWLCGFHLAHFGGGSVFANPS